MVPGPALSVVTVGVDEQDLAPPLFGFGAFCPQDQDGGGDAGAVEQVRSQADHRVQQVVLDDGLADFALDSAPEEHAVGHDRGDNAVLFEYRQHVLEEHQVGLLATLRGVAVLEPLLEGEGGLVVVLAERGVGDHPVEELQITIADVLGAGESVFVEEVGIPDSVQEHVHLGNRPGGAVVLLTCQLQVFGVASAVRHMVAGIDQHSPGARAGVVNGHTFFRVDQTHHQLHHRPRGVELAALLARRVGEVADQILVGGPEQVGELEILVAEPKPRKVVDQVTPFPVRNPGIADPPVEVDVLEHPLQGDVALLQGGQGFVQSVTHLMVEIIAQILPSGPGRNKEGVCVEVGIVGPLLRFRLTLTLVEPAFDNSTAFQLEHVASPFQEQDPEDVLLELRRIHLPPKNVGGSKKMALKLWQGQHDK